MSNILLQLNKVSKIYSVGGDTVKALDDVTLSIHEGEFVAVVGSSGSGKSTLMNILGCLDVPDCGEYFICGENTAQFSERQLASFRNRRIGFIFQGFNLVPALTAIENVELPLIYRGVTRKEREQIAEEALSRVGMIERKNHRPNQLSGGQQQRVAIARAVAAKPPLILADEPTGNLDGNSGDKVTDLMHELHGDGRTVILITHDDTLAKTAQRIIRIHDGKVVSDIVS